MINSKKNLAGETSDGASELAQIMYPDMDENLLKNITEGGRTHSRRNKLRHWYSSKCQ